MTDERQPMEITERRLASMASATVYQPESMGGLLKSMAIELIAAREVIKTVERISNLFWEFQGTPEQFPGEIMERLYGELAKYREIKWRESGDPR